MRKFFQIALFLGLIIPGVAFAHPGVASPQEAYRARVRAWVTSHARPPRDPYLTIAPEENDRAADLVDQLKYTRLQEIEQAQLMQASLPESPWSGYYWPTYAGSVAYRYNDTKFESSLDWQTNVNYLSANLGRGEMETLSPAEKYDLLVGDANFTLANKAMQSGAAYARRHGTVPTWFGICHGWAPASFMLPRPVKEVKVVGADGREITFLPSDLKALASLLWASGDSETRFVSSRCNDKGYEKDTSPRDTNSECFDTNPATWHLAVVNQIGVGKRSFVMDASAGAEVWNQPIYGYQYAYVNPVSGATVKTLEEAKVKLKDWRADPYRQFRSPEAVSAVQIFMTLDYVVETTPNASSFDSAEEDAHTARKYYYDLELNDQDQIVGGEWHTKNHPDFLWVPVKGTKVATVGDAWLERSGNQAKWSGKEALPAEWQAAAKMSSGREQPLARVVNRLFELVKE